MRHGLRGRDARDDETLALDAARREDGASDAGLYEAIAARATDERVVDFGPLFNPAAFAAETFDGAAPQTERRDDAPSALTSAERKESMRRSLHGLVTRVSQRFNVEHRKVHATLNQRVGGSVATATERELDLRRRVAEKWLARDRYDGLR
ncbi:hypothetical protein WPS_03330 [Vulcanimicrobium alpinum]|uniref:Uncharacterized protein n=1 Tax=Vulcanimicrobium alpinum TaxID=3016050 RepID=A0AAN1XSL1_UNVUL|nr:hypothetical protein WPS_03330 [Vulcanimicrobium alpinum]